MNSHVFRKLGVAYKANLKNIVSVLIYSVVFSGIITMTDSAPLNSASTTINEHAYDKNRNFSKELFPVLEERQPPEKYLFLHANNNMWLEILPNGIVKGNTCPTKYGALISGSHSSESLLKSGRDYKVKNGAAVYIKGFVADRYLCVNEYGDIYSSEVHDETDCLFVQKPEVFHDGSHVHYFKHLHHKNTYKTKKLRKKTVRFQLGFYENGTVFVVQKHTQRRNKQMVTINVVHKVMRTNTMCDNNIEIPKRRCKFCRKVWKNFFNASIKQLRRFRKYNCWEKIRQCRTLNRKQKDDTG